MLSKQRVGGDEPLVVRRERRRQRLLSSPIGGPVILALRDESDAREDPQPIGVDWQQLSALHDNENLVGARLADHRKLRQGAAGLGQRDTKRSAQITIPATEDQLGGLAESRGASTGGDGASQPGDSRQLRACGPQNGRRCETDRSSQRREGSAALGVGHKIRDLLPQDQVKGIPADGR